MINIIPMLGTAIGSLINSIIPAFLIAVAYNLLSGNPPVDIVKLIGIWALVSVINLFITQFINFWNAASVSRVILAAMASQGKASK